jgi:hypothetical protein
MQQINGHCVQKLLRLAAKLFTPYLIILHHSAGPKEEYKYSAFTKSFWQKTGKFQVLCYF